MAGISVYSMIFQYSMVIYHRTYHDIGDHVPDWKNNGEKTISWLVNNPDLP